MKYDTLRKRNRNKELIAYRIGHPELSLKEIGEVFNITKQRVSAILKSYNIVKGE